MSGIGCWIFQFQLLTMLSVTKLYDNGEEFGCKIVTVSSERKKIWASKVFCQTGSQYWQVIFVCKFEAHHTCHLRPGDIGPFVLDLHMCCTGFASQHWSPQDYDWSTLGRDPYTYCSRYNTAIAQGSSLRLKDEWQKLIHNYGFSCRWWCVGKHCMLIKIFCLH